MSQDTATDSLGSAARRSVGWWLRHLFAMPEARALPASSRREALFSWLAAGAVGLWIFAFKWKSYIGLTTTSDMYTVAQLATTWLDGRYLQDNWFGNQLAIHTFLSAPVLALFVVPFGVPGLFVALSLSIVLGMQALERILRLAGVPRMVAAGFAVVSTLMPLSLQTYQDVVYGFHIELVVPAMMFWLVYFLLRRSWRGSLLMALALISVKEDVVIGVVAVGATVFAEDAIRRLGAGFRTACLLDGNRPALAVIGLSFLAVPLLLWLLKSQQVAGAPSNLARLRPVNAEAINSNLALIEYFIRNLGTWLQSDIVTRWLGLSCAATLGFVFLRPHLLVAGVVTTLTAWLVQEDLLWAPRYVQALAFLQIMACLGFASAWRIGTELRGGGRLARSLAGGLAVAGLLGAAWGYRSQFKVVPDTAEVYRTEPKLTISPADRLKADALYARYFRERQRGEPVIASPWLARYADYTSQYAYTRLRGRPAPVWILWDKEDKPLSVLWTVLQTDVASDLVDYRLVGEDGRFLLYRRKPEEQLAREKASPGLRVMGEPYGLVRMRITPAEGRGGLIEPILSIGPAGRGELFFVRYLSHRELVLGMESMGTKVVLSEPIAFEPDHTYELEFFTGSLLPPRGLKPETSRLQEWRLRYQSMVRARWNGREVLSFIMPPPHEVRPDEVLAGVNAVRSGSAGERFTGTIAEVTRGGYPALPEEADSEFGAVKLVLQLPAEGAGVPEPLVVTGTSGEATLGYIRILPDNRIRVGAEFWGVGAFESEAVSVVAGQPVEVSFHLPVLYPSPGDFRWGAVAPETQARLRSEMRIMVNGAVVLQRSIKAPVPRLIVPVFGKNPVGGSWVSAAFTGRLLQVLRLPLADGEPPAPAR